MYLRELRHISDRPPQARYYSGRRGFKPVTWSNTPEKRSTWGWTGLNLGLSLGLPHASATVTAGFTRGSNRIKTDPTSNYLHLLQNSSKEPLVLYSKTTKRAWLVPKLSVFHYMALIYLERSHERGSRIATFPYAYPECSGTKTSCVLLYQPQ
jgi:hypothetical protein